MFLHFRNLHLNLNIFEKNMTVIADVFPKLRTPKIVIRYKSKKSRCRRPFDRQHSKRATNTFVIPTTAPLPYLLVILKVIELQKVSFDDMKHLINFCEQIDYP